MNDLTGLEICTQIAIIEGESIESINKKVHDWNHKYYPVEIQLGHAKAVNLQHWYNPSKHDDLCFRLMVKYKIKPHYKSDRFSDEELEYSAMPLDSLHHQHTDYITMKSWLKLTNAKTLNKAICLCVIEAHK